MRCRDVDDINRPAQGRGGSRLLGDRGNSDEPLRFDSNSAEVSGPNGRSIKLQDEPSAAWDTHDRRSSDANQLQQASKT